MQICWVCCFLFSISAWAGNAAVISVVVWPVADQNADETAQWMSGVLLGDLAKNSDLDLVDPQKVANVLRYYQAVPPSEVVANIQTQVATAKEQYFNLNYSASESSLQEAIAGLERDPDLIFSQGSLLLEAYLTLGLVWQAQKQNDSALSAFRKVLAVDPQYLLDASAFSSTVVHLFDQVRSEMRGDGTLLIETDPKVAEVFVNGVARGVTPVKVSGLPNGEYAVSIRTNHYREVKRWVKVTSGSKALVKEKLAWDGTTAIAKLGLTPEEGRDQIGEGIRIANLMHVDKVVLLDVDEADSGSGQITCRMIDRAYRSSHNPIVIRYGADRSELNHQIEKLAILLSKQTAQDLKKNPHAYLDPEGIGDPVLLGTERSDSKNKTWLWSGVGAAAVGGLVGGIVAATGGSSSRTGSVAVSFK